MSRIRSKDTSIERKVFKELRRSGIYFQKNYKKAPGSPDIALPRKKIAIFIDGDFWHGYRYNKWKSRLSSEFWKDKIENNIRRDTRNRRKLKRMGWKVLRVWEHALEKDEDNSINEITCFINGNKK